VVKAIAREETASSAQQ